MMLTGRKRIELRLAKVRRPPFNCVRAGDILWLKPPSRPVCAFATAGRCLFREVHSRRVLAALLKRHARAMGDETAVREYTAAGARFVSLIWLAGVTAVRPVTIQKKDRRGWVVLPVPLRPALKVGRGS